MQKASVGQKPWAWGLEFTETDGLPVSRGDPVRTSVGIDFSTEPGTGHPHSTWCLPRCERMLTKCQSLSASGAEVSGCRGPIIPSRKRKRRGSVSGERRPRVWEHSDSCAVSTARFCFPLDKLFRFLLFHTQMAVSPAQGWCGFDEVNHHVSSPSEQSHGAGRVVQLHAV